MGQGANCLLQDKENPFWVVEWPACSYSRSLERSRIVKGRDKDVDMEVDIRVDILMDIALQWRIERR